MMKEDRNPLRYMTKGIVAINFCWRKKEAQSEETGTNGIWQLKQRGIVTLWRPRVFKRYMDMYVWDKLTINLVDM